MVSVAALLRKRLVLVPLVLALLLGACTSSGSSKAKAKQPRVDLASAGAATFTAGGSVGQVYVTGAPKGGDLAARARRRRRRARAGRRAREPDLP